MKNIFFTSVFLFFFLSSNAQVVFVPGGITGTSTNNNVGVGISAPTEKLHVSGGNGLIQNSNFPYLALLKSGIGTWFIGGLGNTSNTFAIRLNAATPIMEANSTTTWFNAGNVGIGTTNPTEKLTVDGNFYLKKVNPYLFWKGNDLNLKSTSNAIPLVAIRGTANYAARLDIFGAGDTEVKHRLNAAGKSFLNAGYVGIGTTNPKSQLQVDYITQDGIKGKHGIVVNRKMTSLTNVTSYDKAIAGYITTYTIPSGVTDNGYKIGAEGSGHAQNTGFAGTLKTNKGIWARAGIHTSAPTAVVTNAYGLHAELITNAGTITNGYGVYINSPYTSGAITNQYDLYASSTEAKNYFAGTLGVGSGALNPDGNMQIGGSTTNGMLFLGGGKGYAGIGSVRSDGGLALGWNIYSRYTSNDVGIVRVAQDQPYQGYTGMKFSREGVIDFFGHYGPPVVADEVANKIENIRMRISRTGNVGIGTTTPDEKLAVNGNIHTKEVRVDLTGWPDFVFEENYDLPTLQEVETHIKEKGHLENIPSAKEVEVDGIKLGEMNAKLLQKIEELTLYTIEQEKTIQSLVAENKQVKKENELIETKLDKLLELEEKINQLLEDKNN